MADNIAEGMVKAIGDFSRGIAESIVLGKSLQTTLKGIAQTILIEIISAQIKEIAVLLSKLAITKAIAYYNTVSSTGGFFSSLGSIFSGGGDITGIMGSFAEGGMVKGGEPITVGERGRELFIPKTDGTIVPNQDLGVTPNNYNFTIVATDVRGVKELLLNNRSTIVNIMNQALNAKGKSSLV